MLSEKGEIQEIIARYFERVETRLTYTQYVYQIMLRDEPQVTGICGGSASGKSTLAAELVNLLGDDRCVRIMVDGYLKYAREIMDELGLTGYDSESRDITRFLRDLARLKQNHAIQKPVFDEMAQRPAQLLEEIEPREFVILEDTLDFSGIADLTIFTFAPDEIMIRRRMARDLEGNKFWDRESLERYIRRESMPRYKEKHVPVSAMCDLVINTHTNEIFRKIQRRGKHESL